MLAERRLGDRADVDIRRVVRAFGDTIAVEDRSSIASQSAVADQVEDLLTCGSDGMALVSGPSGAGKSLLAALLASRSPRMSCVPVVVENGLLDFDGLLLEMASQLSGSRQLPAPHWGRYERLALFKQCLIDHVIRTGRRLALFLDDAEMLAPDTMAGVASLCNLRSDGRSHVVPVLFGSPETVSGLAACRPAASRTGSVLQLPGLGPDELPRFVIDRLASVDIEASRVFELDALSNLHALTRGLPRLVNSACRSAARAALTAGRRIRACDLAEACHRLPSGEQAASRVVAFGR